MRLCGCVLCWAERRAEWRGQRPPALVWSQCGSGRDLLPLPHAHSPLSDLPVSPARRGPSMSTSAASLWAAAAAHGRDALWQQRTRRFPSCAVECCWSFQAHVLLLHAISFFGIFTIAQAKISRVWRQPARQQQVAEIMDRLSQAVPCGCEIKEIFTLHCRVFVGWNPQSFVFPRQHWPLCSYRHTLHDLKAAKPALSQEASSTAVWRCSARTIDALHHRPFVQSAYREIEVPQEIPWIPSYMDSFSKDNDRIPLDVGGYALC